MTAIFLPLDKVTTKIGLSETFFKWTFYFRRQNWKILVIFMHHVQGLIGADSHQEKP
jgi:hypothetical protein